MGHGGRSAQPPPARLDADSAVAIAATLQALTAPSRLLILARLRESPCTVTEITAAVGMEQSAVSHQLRLLRTMGLVASARTGRNVTYCLYDDHVASLLDEAIYHAEHLRLGVPDRPGAVVADEASSRAGSATVTTSNSSAVRPGRSSRSRKSISG